MKNADHLAAEDLAQLVFDLLQVVIMYLRSRMKFVHVEQHFHPVCINNSNKKSNFPI